MEETKKTVWVDRITTGYRAGNLEQPDAIEGPPAIPPGMSAEGKKHMKEWHARMSPRKPPPAQFKTPQEYADFCIENATEKRVEDGRSIFFGTHADGTPYVFTPTNEYLKAWGEKKQEEEPVHLEFRNKAAEVRFKWAYKVIKKKGTNTPVPFAIVGTTGNVLVVSNHRAAFVKNIFPPRDYQCVVGECGEIHEVDDDGYNNKFPVPQDSIREWAVIVKPDAARIRFVLDDKKIKQIANAVKIWKLDSLSGLTIKGGSFAPDHRTPDDSKIDTTVPGPKSIDGYNAECAVNPAYFLDAACDAAIVEWPASFHDPLIFKTEHGEAIVMPMRLNGEPSNSEGDDADANTQEE